MPKAKEKAGAGKSKTPGAGKKGKKGKNKKPKKKSLKVQVKELTEENDKLNLDINILINEMEELKNKITTVNSKLLTGLDRSTLQDKFDITELTDPLLIHTEALLKLLDSIIIKKQRYDVSIEIRLAELEFRVTDLNVSLAMNTKKALAYESGLEELSKCESMDEVKNTIFNLQFLAGQAYHEVATCDPIDIKENFGQVDGLNGQGDHPDAHVKRNIDIIKTLHLVPPKERSPGDTRISKMNKDLTLYLVSELSLEKQSGADWRMFAERCGVPEETMEEWKHSKMKYPMAQVLSEWCFRDEGSTVRILHRHLSSPQMRCTLLAKYVADFYEVD